nr:PLP-dependent transferase [Enterobacteriaceae endosymbiont of Donacia clavipes]
MGITNSIFDIYFLLKAIKILCFRLKLAQNILIIIKYLKLQKIVKKIYHFLLKNNIGHKITKDKTKRFRTIFNFEYNDSKKMLKFFLNSLKLFTLVKFFR